MLHFQGRDDELGELVGSAITKVTTENISRTAAYQIKASIDAGKGVGGLAIINITKARRQLHAKDDGQADGKDDSGCAILGEIRDRHLQGARIGGEQCQAGMRSSFSALNSYQTHLVKISKALKRRAELLRAKATMCG